MALLVACVAPLRQAIAKLNMRSTPMPNYIDNGKRQERAADDAAAVQH
jgi:hypothetical protein